MRCVAIFTRVTIVTLKLQLRRIAWPSLVAIATNNIAFAESQGVNKSRKWDKWSANATCPTSKPCHKCDTSLQNCKTSPLFCNVSFAIQTSQMRESKMRIVSRICKTCNTNEEPAKIETSSNTPKLV